MRGSGKPGVEIGKRTLQVGTFGKCGEGIIHLGRRNDYCNTWRKEACNSGEEW